MGWGPGRAAGAAVSGGDMRGRGDGEHPGGGSGWDGIFDAERYTQPHLRSGLVEPEL